MLIVGGVVAADLLVVGLDLVTGREVHAGDRRTEEWRKKGHNGDRTLVCLACYEGADLPDGPRTVALVPKGREGGARHQHFAHPPGMVPPGGQHSPESRWHAGGKHAIREWAEAQGFTARAEARTADGRRRSDVELILPGGHRLAIPDTWCFGCDICGLELTGAMLEVSPVVHVIRTMERSRAGRPREIELRYGGAPSPGQMPAA
jgi:hypothetical protein